MARIIRRNTNYKGTDMKQEAPLWRQIAKHVTSTNNNNNNRLCSAFSRAVKYWEHWIFCFLWLFPCNPPFIMVRGEEEGDTAAREVKRRRKEGEMGKGGEGEVAPFKTFTINDTYQVQPRSIFIIIHYNILGFTQFTCHFFSLSCFYCNVSLLIP